MFKGINDPVHGTILLGKLEQAVIDHRFFQRLRRVKALGLLEFAFPSARHSRFEHSIGAYHVVGRLLEAIKRVTAGLEEERRKWNQDSLFNCLTEDELKNVFADKLVQATKLAGLLHDVGHGPFSHASECVMPTRDELIAQNPSAEKIVIEAIRRKSKKNAKADHEDYSLLMVDAILKDVPELPDELRLLTIAIKSKDIDVPPEFKPLEPQIRFLQTLVDGELDCDRMDYLLRDSLFCGVPYGKYDLERLLDGLIILKDKGGAFVLGIRRSSLSALEDFIFARFQMHVQIYTHKTDGSCNLAFKKIASRNGAVLPADLGSYVLLDDESIITQKPFEDFAEVRQERKLWPMVFESFSSDGATDTAVIHELTTNIPDGHWAKQESEKPIKKATLLDFPVVTRDPSGNFFAQQIKGLSQLVANYNANFVVRRVFVSPEHEKTARWESLGKGSSAPGAGPVGSNVTEFKKTGNG